MNRIRIFSVAALAASLVGLGCTPSKEDQPPKPKVTAEKASGDQPNPRNTMAAQQPTAPSPSSLALPAIASAPAWQLRDVNGAVVSSDQFKGKVVVLDFWATYCAPCVQEIPGYIELAQKYGNDGLVIVGVSLDQGGPAVVKQFAARHGVNYPLVMADENILAAFGGVEVIPTTFLIDRQGQIRDRKEGAMETAAYEKKILAVLN